MAEQLRKALAILRLKQAASRIGLRRSSIYDRLNPKSPRFDPSFPKPIVLGQGERTRAIGFIEAEVEEWIQRQIEAREAA